MLQNLVNQAISSLTLASALYTQTPAYEAKKQEQVRNRQLDKERRTAVTAKDNIKKYLDVDPNVVKDSNDPSGDTYKSFPKAYKPLIDRYTSLQGRIAELSNYEDQETTNKWLSNNNFSNYTDPEATNKTPDALINPQATVSAPAAVQTQQRVNIIKQGKAASTPIISDDGVISTQKVNKAPSKFEFWDDVEKPVPYSDDKSASALNKLSEEVTMNALATPTISEEGKVDSPALKAIESLTPLTKEDLVDPKKHRASLLRKESSFEDQESYNNWFDSLSVKDKDIINKYYADQAESEIKNQSPEQYAAQKELSKMPEYDTFFRDYLEHNNLSPEAHNEVDLGSYTKDDIKTIFGAHALPSYAKAVRLIQKAYPEVNWIVPDWVDHINHTTEAANEKRAVARTKTEDIDPSNPF